MHIEKKSIENLYIKKLETSLIYEVAALKLKGFAEVIYLLFMNFRQQDKTHAIALHGLLVELDELSDEQSMVAIQPYRLKGIGNENKEEDDEKELFMTMTRNFCQSLIYAEKNIVSSIMGVNQYYSSLIDIARPHIVLDGLQDISSHRIQVLKRLDNLVQTDTIFISKSEETVWKCTYCGNLTTSAPAPETCPCCNQPQQYQIRGDWNI